MPQLTIPERLIVLAWPAMLLLLAKFPVALPKQTHLILTSIFLLMWVGAVILFWNLMAARELDGRMAWLAAALAVGSLGGNALLLYLGGEWISAAESS